MKKKFLSIAVCLCMIMTMIPGGVLQPDAAWAAGHTSHCVCGGSTAIGDHTAHNSDTVWTGVSNLTDITQAGNYYLTDNVTLTETWKPADGVALCLNGYDIQAKGSFDVITIEDGVTFTVTECSSSTQGKITHTSGSGRGILVNNTAVFNMYGGDVTGNSCSQEGAGVNARGIFNMYGGSITGNTMTADYNYSGGGVCVGSTYSGTGETRSQTFNMYGGSISQNKSRGGGGGVDIGSGTFNLHNGSIAKNESKTAGGGVYAGHQKLNMYGGSITENSCSSTSVGGGVYVGQYYWEDANLTVSGNVTIENNKKGETPNNVYLQSPSNYITVIGIGQEGLDSSARIGVSTSETPATKGIKIVEENDADYSANFFSDEGYYVNYNSSKQLELLQTKPGHEHPVCGKTCSHTSAHSTISASEWKPIATGEELNAISEAGYYYLTDNITTFETWKPVDGVVLCLNGKTILLNNCDSTDLANVIKVTNHFTLTDCETGNVQGKIMHVIEEDSTKGKGVGVEVFGGTFDMYGGNIADNKSTFTYGGGGVAVRSENAFSTGKKGTFNMYGGKVSDNMARFGGGVSVMWGATFTMAGGKISGNAATFGDSSDYKGGGVYVGHTSKFVMTGGEVKNNTAVNDGGGVYLGAFAKDNEYSSNRGTAAFEISGKATVINNRMSSEANNVYLDSSSTDYESISAEITITGNLTGKIGVTAGAAVPATIATGADSDTNYTNVITSDNADYEIAHDSDDATKLILKDPNAPIPVKEHKHCVCGEGTLSVEGHAHNKEQKWTEIKTLTNDMEAGYYYLTNDIILTGKWKPANDVVLCLNGHNIICNAGTYGFSVSAIGIDSNDTLVLTDCHTGSEAGKVTHGKDSSDKRFMGRGVSNYGTFIMYNISIADNDNTSTSFSGGGVENNAGATFTMYNGSITGNKDVNGGGVYNNYGTFNMYGGTISGNTASNNGGGVFNAGNSDSNAVFNMYGGTIKGNTALSTGTNSSNGLGGGICNAGGFNMYGGVIGGTEAADANIASNRGGGLYNGKTYYTSSPVLNMSGAVNIIGNKVNNKDNNLYLYNQESSMAVTADSLEEGSRIGVSSCTEPSAENPVVITNKGCNVVYFFSDDNSCEIGSDSDNAVILKKKDITHEHTWDTAWKHNDTYHWHECTDADCKEINDKEKHSGGTATCTEKAVCRVCNTPYGEVSEHEFGGKYKYSAAGHWQECQREGCTATGSITDHIYDNSSDVTCNICGYVRTVKPGTSGKTDNVINKAEDRNAGTAASTTATIKPSTTTSGEKKTTTATVDNTTANKILDKAVSNKSTEVIINTLTRAGISEAQAGTATEIALPEKTVRELSEKTEASLIIRSDAAEITLDKKSVDGLAAQAGTDGYVRLIVEIVKQDSNTLEAELKLITSKGTVTDFKGGNVSVMVKLNDTLAAKDLVCVYIDDSNIYHMVNGAKNSDGTYSFMTGHFSTYAVMARSEAEKVIAEQNADKATELVKSVKLKARSAKTAKGNIRVTLSVANGRDSIKALEDLGYTVKYKYYRSTSRAKNYKSMLEGTGKTYINTAGKKGTKYFYKARLTVYDAQGRLIAKTELKQCRYACRVK